MIAMLAATTSSIRHSNSTAVVWVYTGVAMVVCAAAAACAYIVHRAIARAVMSRNSAPGRSYPA
eukprot:scaffold8277_cov157-Isochrysis_galbana.AAC.4